MPEMSFGRTIRFRRNKLGLSQNRLGELVGRSGAAVRSWERDSSTPTDPSVLQALSAVLGIESEVLFDKAGVDAPVVETSPTVEQVLQSLTPAEEEVRQDLRTLEAPPIEPEPIETEEAPSDDEDTGELVGASDAEPPDEPVEPPQEEAEEPVEQPVLEEDHHDDAEDVPPSDREPVTVGVAPIGGRQSTPAPQQPAFTSSGPRFLYTTPAPPLPEPTYMEDESQRQLYRIRNLATLVLTVGLIVLFVWALGNGWQNFTEWWDDFVSYLQI